ncbi:MAG: DUF1080 domain-containing protein [Planctomycetota bacterium]|nr:DUF1080 domain-containing protein [Planctomycetota bacterium]
MTARRTVCTSLVSALLALAVGTATGTAQEKPRKKRTAVNIDDPKQAAARPDFRAQGEYVGEIRTKDGPKKIGVQVMTKGNRKTGAIAFEAVGYGGGLPGAGWNSKEPERVESESAKGVITFAGKHGRAELGGGVIKVFNAGGEEIGRLEKTHRKSPTLGKKPPPGAVVLFDGKTADLFENGELTKDGLLTQGKKQGAETRREFGSCHLHLEFRVPYRPFASGQGRGNSGVYLQGRYEVQVLDSFGDSPGHDRGGGIYQVAPPRKNMCLPPLSWQTYDIDFRAAVYEGDKQVRPATLTVRHNGVLTHENVPVPKETVAAIRKAGPRKGPLHLQNHGSPVRYRNIWLVEKD